VLARVCLRLAHQELTSYRPTGTNTAITTTGTPLHVHAHVMPGSTTTMTPPTIATMTMAMVVRPTLTTSRSKGAERSIFFSPIVERRADSECLAGPPGSACVEAPVLVLNIAAPSGQP
jgi:hypothetical protein